MDYVVLRTMQDLRTYVRTTKARRAVASTPWIAHVALKTYNLPILTTADVIDEVPEKSVDITTREVHQWKSIAWDKAHTLPMLFMPDLLYTLGGAPWLADSHPFIHKIFPVVGVVEIGVPVPKSVCKKLYTAMCDRNGPGDAPIVIVNQGTCSHYPIPPFGCGMHIVVSSLKTLAALLLQFQRTGSVPHILSVQWIHHGNGDNAGAAQYAQELLGNVPFLIASGVEEFARNLKDHEYGECEVQFGTNLQQYAPGLHVRRLLSPWKVDVMFFAPWHDQGLGMQTKTYIAALAKRNITCAVCSFASYLAETTAHAMYQADAEEWEIVCARVYYSPYTREKFTNAELCACLAQFCPKTVVIPETCWYRVFEVAKLCRDAGVHVVGVPNIELVRTDEVHKHAVFHSLACNNKYTQTVLKTYMPDIPSALIYYAPAEKPTPKGHARADGITRLLVVGGYNLDGRKQGPAIVSAFQEAKLPSNIQLHIWAQTASSSCATEAVAIASGLIATGQIVFNVAELPHSAILDLYATYDATIMVSKHEGLGLGFFEALAQGCPVVTCDTAPHNEIVTHNVTGWLLPGTVSPIKENMHALPCVKSFLFSAPHLTAWFKTCQKDPLIAQPDRVKVAKTFWKSCQGKTFPDRLVGAFLPTP